MKPIPKSAILLVLGGAIWLAASKQAATQTSAPAHTAGSKIEIFDTATGGLIMTNRMEKTDEEWRKQLTSEQFKVARKAGTERAFTGAYWDNHETGVYKCVCCGQDLYSSDAKFESGTGWPSFAQAVSKENVKTKDDSSLFMHRTELLCSRCDAHLGHVFDDGPAPTGERHCINSASLVFKKKE